MSIEFMQLIYLPSTPLSSPDSSTSFLHVNTSRLIFPLPALPSSLKRLLLLNPKISGPSLSNPFFFAASTKFFLFGGCRSSLLNVHNLASCNATAAMKPHLSFTPFFVTPTPTTRIFQSSRSTFPKRSTRYPTTRCCEVPRRSALTHFCSNTSALFTKTLSLVSMISPCTHNVAFVKGIPSLLFYLSWLLMSPFLSQKAMASKLAISPSGLFLMQTMFCFFLLFVTTSRSNFLYLVT